MTREEHLLTILGEECGEVAQRVSKALRFGTPEVQPGQALTNVERIAHEMNDLFAVVEMLVAEGVLPIGYVNEQSIAAKKRKVELFLRYSLEQGTLDESQENDQEISDDDLVTVACWLPHIARNEVRDVIRFGLARGLGHAASDETLAAKIAEEWLA